MWDKQGRVGGWVDDFRAVVESTPRERVSKELAYLTRGKYDTIPCTNIIVEKGLLPSRH